MDNTKDYDIYKKNHDMVESKHHSICEDEKKSTLILMSKHKTLTK